MEKMLKFFNSNLISYNDNAIADCNDENCIKKQEKEKIMKKCAFTLAEVLITLSIIGVVAALTLPSLIQHHNKVVWVNQLKKSVNTLENGFRMAMAEDGVEKISDTVLWAKINTYSDFCSGDNPVFCEYLKKYFNVTYYPYRSNPQVVRRLEFLDKNGSITWPIEFVFNDGAEMMFHNGLSMNNGLRSPQFNPKASGYGLALIWIDVNGSKKPNKFGRDIFNLVLRDDGHISALGNNDMVREFCAIAACASYNSSQYNSCCESCTQSILSTLDDCGNNSYGTTCANRIIENGWKMDY